MSKMQAYNNLTLLIEVGEYIMEALVNEKVPIVQQTSVIQAAIHPNDVFIKLKYIQQQHQEFQLG